MPNDVRDKIAKTLRHYIEFAGDMDESQAITAILSVIGEETIKMERKSYKSLACEFGRDWTQGYNQCLTDLRARLEK